MKTKLLNVFGWLFLFCAVLVFIVSIVSCQNILDGLKNVVPAGVFIALAGNLFTQSKVVADAEEKHSSFALEGFKNAFSHATTLLEDGNNNRAIWIEAARSIGNGLELAAEVTIDTHKRVLEIERLKQRGFFCMILSSKSPSFYYGVSQDYATLDEAAAASTAPHDKQYIQEISPKNEIADESIRMVYLAAQWPDGYKDPLGLKFNNEDIKVLSMRFPFVHDYIQHKIMWRSCAGQLHVRTR